ncbi:MAG: hypothetical protein E6Q99_08070 [Elusimicrobia bacterium]|nr:MAG: hypothetical protein E6Q99_08070 [Elusimicrobiota bacterium]
MKRLPALLGAWLLAAPLLAAEKSDHARLRLPWDALKNVLRIDQDRVRLSAEEFDALIKRTSRKNPPAHVVADGDVLLSRAEFTRLIQSLVPPAEPAATVFAPKAVYRGRLLKNSAAVEATLHVEMPEKPAAPIVWDAFPAQAAFQSIVLDGKPALAAVRNGRLYITLTDAGAHRLDLRFSVPVPDATAGQTLGLPLANTPITEWIFEVPEPNLDIAVPGALHRELSAAPGGTRVRALLPPTSWVTMAWNPLAPDRAKGPAQVYAVVDHLVSVEEDAVRATAHVALDVLQNTINEALLVPPAGFAVLDVRGEAVKDWQERADPARLAVSLKSARKGRVDFFVTLERVLPGEKSTTTYAGLTVLGAQRQRGHLGVELKSDVELPAPVIGGLEPKDPFRELPADLVARADRLVYGYRHLGGPLSLSLTLSRHETVALPLTFVDRMVGTTVIRPDGKRVHRVTLWAQSSARQFLGLALPPRASLWSVFVDGAPVKPVVGTDKKTMIPLIRSAGGRAGLFPVELVVYEEKPRLFPFGREGLALPMPDILVNRLQWNVVVPPDRNFRYLGHDFEDLNRRPTETTAASREGAAVFKAKKNAAPSTQRLFVGDKDDRANRGFDIGSAEEKQEREVDALSAVAEEPPPPAPVLGGEHGQSAGFSGLPAGTLPVRVNVPETGVRLSFSKTLPPAGGPLALSLWHWPTWVDELAPFLLAFGVALLAVRFRGPLRARGKSLLERAVAARKAVRLRPTPFQWVFLALTAALAAAVVAAVKARKTH